MKKNKIFSAILAVAMLCTTFTNAFAAMTTTGKEKLTMEAEKVDFSDDKYSDFKSYDYGLPTYLLTIYATGINMKTTASTGMGSAGKVDGDSITVWTANMYYDVSKGGTDGENYMYETVYPYADSDPAWTLNTILTDDDGNVVKAMTIGGAGGTMINPKAGEVASYTETDKIKLYQAIVIVDDEHSVKFGLKDAGAYLKFGSFKKNVKEADLFKLDGNLDELTVDTTSITLPLAESVKVSSITVNANDTMVNGTTQTATATVAPEGATNREVTWSVENGTGAATITAAGVITATQAGTVTVKATAKDGSNVYGTKTITITEPAPTKPTVTVSTQVGNSGKSWAWLLTITNHMAGFDYKGQFKSGSDTENVDINVTGISGGAEFRKIIVLETEKTNPTFKAEAEAVN